MIEEKHMKKYAEIGFMTRNFGATLLIAVMAISVLNSVLVLTAAQTSAQTTAATGITKIAPTLLSKIGKSGMVNVLIETYTKDYSSVVSDINMLGGKVTHEYSHVKALAASIPADKVFQLAKNSDVKRIYYDEKRMVASSPNLFFGRNSGFKNFEPEAGIPIPLTGEYKEVSITHEQLAALEPNTYWNPTAMEATPIWDEGYMGQDSLVVIIDTGIWTGHFMFADTNVTGGIDISADVGTEFEGWDKETNHYHGSHVAGILAGAGGIIVPEDDPLAVAIEMYTGETLPEYEPGYKIIWLLGMAPEAALYIIKVFDHTGGPTPESTILEALDYVADMKENQGIDVDVVSMSLGGPTLYDGRDVEDQLVDRLTSLGITVVAAAGNDGPASMTVSSPGSANTAITVAAAAHPVNTRVFWDVYYEWPGIGYYLYTSEEPQIYAFSSRGPTSDGRGKPTVSATGLFVLSAYPPAGEGGLAWVSGTSMATPAVSGAVALLNSYAENNTLGASPQDYKEAVTSGAVWLTGYSEYDQGAGYLNASGALEALKTDPEYGTLPPDLPPEGQLEDITNIPIVGSGEYTATITDLAPGHKEEFIFEVTEATNSVMLNVSVTDLGEDPLVMNSFEVYIQSAKRTYYDYYIDSANVYGDAWFFLADEETTWGGDTYGVYFNSHVIEPGYMKIVIENDWTSYDSISGNITIKVTEGALPFPPDFVYSEEIAEGEELEINVPVPEWAGKTIIELWWLRNWSTYPTSDLDLIVFWDEGPNFDGATLNSPERVVIRNPTTLTVIVSVYQIYAANETFELKVYFYILGDVNCDGKVDTRDLSEAATAFGSYLGDVRWNPNADVNCDGVVDIRDLALIASNFGKTKL